MKIFLKNFKDKCVFNIDIKKFKKLLFYLFFNPKMALKDSIFFIIFKKQIIEEERNQH